MPSEPQRAATEIGSGDAGTIRAATEVLSGKSRKGFIRRLLPLILFTMRKDVMVELVNRRGTTILASLVAGLIIALNLFLIYQTFFGG